MIRSLIPLSAPIFCAEPRHKRISTTIGAMICVSKRKNREEGGFQKKRRLEKEPLRLSAFAAKPYKNGLKPDNSAKTALKNRCKIKKNE